MIAVSIRFERGYVAHESTPLITAIEEVSIRFERGYVAHGKRPVNAHRSITVSIRFERGYVAH